MEVDIKVVKKVKRVMKSIPLDCWGEVMIFLSSRGDFMSLVLSVKGLYCYLKKIRPQCSENIGFFFSGVPWRTQEHVTYLRFVMESQDLDNVYENMGSEICPLLEKAQSSNWKFMFDNLEDRFPNLLRLDIGFFGNIGESISFDEVSESGKIISFTDMKENNLIQNLRRIRIEYPNEIEIQEKFSRVEEFVVSSGEDYYDTTDGLFPLNIGCGCLPSCSLFDVSGNRVNGLKFLRNCLKKLVLNNNAEPKSMETLEGFTELEEIDFTRGKNFSFHQIKNLPKLKHYKHYIHECLEETYMDYDADILRTQVMKKFEILYFDSTPLIEEVHFWDLSYYGEEDTVIQSFLPLRKLLILDLLHLRKLEVRVPRKVCIEKMPNLEVLYISSVAAMISGVRSMKKLKRVEILTRSGTEFKPNFEISDFEKLEYFECVSLYEEEGYVKDPNSDSDYFIIRNNPVLKTIKVDRVLTLDNCPSLEVFHYRVNNGRSVSFQNFLFHEITLKDVVLEVEPRRKSDEDLEQYKSIEKSLFSISSFRKVKRLEVSCGFSVEDVPPLVLKETLYHVDELTLNYSGSGLVIGGASNYYSMFFVLKKLTLESESNVTIRNAPNLEEFSWEFGNDDTNSPSSIVIERCPCLKTVEFTQCSRTCRNCSFDQLFLHHLPKLEVLKFGENFTGIKNLSIIRSPIVKLQVRLFTPCERYDRASKSSFFDISGSLFPNLTEVEITTGVRSRDDNFYDFDEERVMKIGEFKYPDSLKTIHLKDKGCRKTGFARKIYNEEKKIVKYKRKEKKSYQSFLKKIWKEYSKIRSAQEDDDGDGSGLDIN